MAAIFSKGRASPPPKSTPFKDASEADSLISRECGDPRSEATAGMPCVLSADVLILSEMQRLLFAPEVRQLPLSIASVRVFGQSLLTRAWMYFGGCAATESKSSCGYC